jgi:hypothetical protein
MCTSVMATGRAEFQDSILLSYMSYLHLRLPMDLVMVEHANATSIQPPMSSHRAD